MKPEDYRKLTAEARNALVCANQEALRRGHQEVNAADLLLGLRATQPGRVAEILRLSGMVSLQQARDARAYPPSLPANRAIENRLSSELLRALDTASRDQDEVSASALCEALLSADNTATELLAILGVDRSRLLARLRSESNPQHALEQQVSSLEERVRLAVERAGLLATSVGRIADDGDVAVTLFDEPGSSLARALRHLGITRELLEEALADTRPHS